MKLWQAAGMPPGVINMVQGGRDTGIALSQHPGLDGLLFTGSAATGRALHRAFAGHPEKMLVLEMGGNNPLIVWDASDLTSAAYLTVQSAFITSGQRCTCARRLIVEDGANGAKFIDRLVSMIQKIRIGPHTDSPEPFMGQIISEQAAQQLLLAQARLVKSGANALVEMKQSGLMSTMLSPGLIDVTNAEDRRDEELFGPLLQLIRVPDFDAALVEANNTAYGLAASLISDSKELYKRFYCKIRSGVINWNRQTTGASARLPFGGVRGSGNHRPSAYFAADYCSYPVACIETDRPGQPAQMPPGIAIS
jgi:succinylglutamic semialdehyde dehydrogenase